MVLDMEMTVDDSNRDKLSGQNSKISTRLLGWIGRLAQWVSGSTASECLGMGRCKLRLSVYGDCHAYGRCRLAWSDDDDSQDTN